VFEVIGHNKFKTNVIIFFFFCLLALVVYFFCDYFSFGYMGVPFAIIIALVSTFGSYYFSDKIVLTISRARPADDNEDKMVKNSVEGLCLAAGLPLPQVYIIDDSAPNAFATGRNPDHSVVCVTTGLLDKLDSYELEAVLAHELGHIKNYDILLSTIATVMVGIITLLADWFFRVGFRSKNEDRSNVSVIIGLIGIVFMIFSPLIAQLMQLALSRNREYLADATSVELTRNPEALIRALQRISADTEPLEAANKATANMYIVTPFKDNRKKIASWFSTHPAIEDRVEAIKNIH